MIVCDRKPDRRSKNRGKNVLAGGLIRPSVSGKSERGAQKEEKTRKGRNRGWGKVSPRTKTGTKKAEKGSLQKGRVLDWDAKKKCNR